MKHKNSLPKKTLVTILVSVMAIVVLLGGSYAIYTSQVFQRSVVRNRNADVIRFSSDKLYRVATNSPLQTYYYPMSKGQTTMSFTICNCDQNKNTLICEKDINYVITFSIPEGTNSFSYQVTDASGITYTSVNGEIVLNNGKLNGGIRTTNTYTIDFSGTGYENTKISVVAKPITTDMPLTKNTCLQATLVPVEYATVQGITLKSEFTDSTRPDSTPKQFDAYNYSVSISGGEKDVIIGWNADELDIDPFFKNKFESTLSTDENGFTTLTVHMNSEDSTGTYLIQFYYHSGHSVSWTSWNDLPIYAKLVNE